MPHFIDHMTDVPDGKVDIYPIVGLAENNFTDVEWNSICQALIDTRERVISTITGSISLSGSVIALSSRVDSLSGSVIALSSVVNLISGSDRSFISGSAENLAPSASLSSQTPVTLLSYDLPFSLSSPRTVRVIANGTCYGGGGTNFVYYISVNGVATTIRNLFINALNVHHAWSGSWLVTIPTGSVNIRLNGYRIDFANGIAFNNDDFIKFTFFG